MSAIPILRLGDSGPAVVAAQEALAAHGHPVKVDGKYGPKTKAAVGDFQREVLLPTDGVIGPQTGERLGLVVSASAPPADGWELAPALQELLRQIDAAAPDRKRTSDGTKGDDAHAARTSDHNPLDHDDDPSTLELVLAMDVTHDPAGKCDCGALAAALVFSRDPRVKYIIWNRRIINSSVVSGAPSWTWRPYSGSNPHSAHIHVSIKPDKGRAEDVSKWLLVGWPAAAAAPAPAPRPSSPSLAPELTGWARFIDWLFSWFRRGDK